MKVRALLSTLVISPPEEPKNEFDPTDDALAILLASAFASPSSPSPLDRAVSDPYSVEEACMTPVEKKRALSPPTGKPAKVAASQDWAFRPG